MQTSFCILLVQIGEYAVVRLGQASLSRHINEENHLFPFEVVAHFDDIAVDVADFNVLQIARWLRKLVFSSLEDYLR